MTAPSILALVRHGESAWIAEGRFQGRGDPRLSDLGVRQAAALGARLAATNESPEVPVPAEPPIAIWHSPLLRAVQTAGAIHEAREADAPLRSLDSLTELSQGEWEGLTHDEVRERYADQLAAWHQDPLGNHAPGGESLSDAAQRARAAAATILALGDADRSSAPLTERLLDPVLGYEANRKTEQRPRWSVVVAHDGILRLLLLELMGISIERFWSFPFGLASVSVVDFSSGAARLRAHNLDEHIAALTR